MTFTEADIALVAPGQAGSVDLSAKDADIKRGHFVYLTTTGAALSNAGAAASSAVIGVVTAIAGRGGMNKDKSTAGDTLTICYDGEVEGFSGLTVGARQYVSTTGGEITETASTDSGDSVVVAGIATAADRVLVGKSLANFTTNA